MNAKTTRILKEARALFWPWCAVTLMGAVPLFQRQPRYIVLGSNVTEISLIFCLIGIALLANLSLGNEFQHRTLSLLLSQPVSRMEIWGEKMSVTIVAVLSAALVLCYSWLSALQQDPKLWVFAGAWIIATFASATFCTLLATSTLGGVTLNGCVNYFIPLVWMNLEWIRERGFLSPSNITVVSTVFLCYVGAMLWLGARKLARFQVTGGMAGDDLLMAGPDVMRGALAGWFRCRPTGAVLNLIRKELRLLRPVWLITLLSVLGWTCVTMLRLLPERAFGRLIVPHRGSSELPLSFLAVGMVAALSIAIAIFAGSLSLGEERTSGTHSWHMTLPVSARRQWLIKLVMALLTSFVCAGLLPALVLIAGGSLFGSPLMFVDPHGAMVWLVVMPLLTFASFWCACAFNGTVRAVLWLFPMLGALVIAGQFGERVARGLLALPVLWKFDLFPDAAFMSYPLNIQLLVIGAAPFRVVTFLLIPTLLIAVIQSYRLFRAQPQDSARSAVRNLAPLAITAFLCSFSLAAFYAFAGHAKQQRWKLLRETHQWIEKIQPRAGSERQRPKPPQTA